MIPTPLQGFSPITAIARSTGLAGLRRQLPFARGNGYFFDEHLYQVSDDEEWEGDLPTPFSRGDIFLVSLNPTRGQAIRKTSLAIIVSPNETEYPYEYFYRLHR